MPLKVGMQISIEVEGAISISLKSSTMLVTICWWWLHLCNLLLVVKGIPKIWQHGTNMKEYRLIVYEGIYQAGDV